jgi:hypothetical protein
MKTVRQEIWAPVRIDQYCSIQHAEESQHTQVLDIDSTLVPQASLMNGNARSIGNSRSIAALSDSQSVNRKLRDTRNLPEDL